MNLRKYMDYKALLKWILPRLCSVLFLGFCFSVDLYVRANDASVLTMADRVELAKSWSGPNSAELMRFLDSGNTAEFDRSLLGYMRTRQSPRFFFSEADIPTRVEWIRQHLAADMQDTISHADSILRHLFPRADSPGPYDVQLEDNFSWLKNPGSDPQTLLVLNRHRFWVQLAMAYRMTGEIRYADELKRQIVTWSRDQQRPPLEDAENWLKYAPRWYLLDSAIRADTWMWVYYLLYQTDAWTPDINTLFLHRLMLHGQYLDLLTSPQKYQNNWLIMQAQGLVNIGVLFPELNQSAIWKKHGIEVLTLAMDLQFRADGGHFEQSPTYHLGCIRWLLEAFYLAKLNGCNEADVPLQKLHRAIDAYYQMLHPDGTTPIFSDSDMVRSSGILATAALVYKEPQWASLDDISARQIWILGPHDPSQIPAGKRPDILALPNSGYYVMRSGSGPQDCQLTFDCGPRGRGHGHSDLLSFELFGFGRVLLCDPGRWKYLEDQDRQWVISTPAHNTISIDGQNHEHVEDDDVGKIFRVAAWDVADDHVLIQTWHCAYSQLAGQPVVGRTLWYDRRNTFIILDWGTSQVDHRYTVSFTLPGKDASPVVNGMIHSQRSDGNVMVCTLPAAKQTHVREERFWSPVYGLHEPAVRYAVSQNGRQVVFGHLVHVYKKQEPEPLHASWTLSADGNQPISVQWEQGGRKRSVVLPIK